MEETPRTVRLAERAPFDVSARGVTATLLRADIEAARSGAGPAELVLDVRRGQGAEVEAHSIAVEWSPADLERLLEDGDADEVTIAFDRDEMTAVMDAEADVEAHGLREKALVLTVVAVTGLSTAGVAQARPAAGLTGTAAVVASAPASEQVPAATTGGADTAGAVDQASPATTIGGAATKAPEVIRAAAAAPATTTGGATAAQAPAPSESPATTMGGAGAPPVASNTAGQIGSTDSASSLSTAEEAALAGAVGVVIAAAGFAAAASRRRRPIQPA
jgi:hypothetical protein